MNKRLRTVTLLLCFGQTFRIVARRITEPGAVATGGQESDIFELESGRYRSRFCNISASLLKTILLCFLIGPWNLPGSALAQAPKTQLTQINSYVKEIDQYIKRNAKLRRIFADVAEYDKTPSWREFKTETEAEKASNLNQSADVWARGGRVVAANVTFTSPSGDWAHLIMYYFRDDGSLAKIDAQLNTFYGDVSIVRDQYFNSRGVRISSTQKFLDLKTQKPKKPGEHFDHAVPVYRKVSELPFFKLL